MSSATTKTKTAVKGNSKADAAVQRRSVRRMSAAKGRRTTTAPESSERARPQSAAMPSPFLPIAEYAFLSDCHAGSESR